MSRDPTPPPKTQPAPEDVPTSNAIPPYKSDPPYEPRPSSNPAPPVHRDEDERWTVHKTASGYQVHERGQRLASSLHARDAEQLVEAHNLLVTLFYMGAPQALLECDEALRVTEARADSLQARVDALERALSKAADRADELWNAEHGTNATYRARSQGITEAVDRLRSALSDPVEETES